MANKPQEKDDKLELLRTLKDKLQNLTFLLEDAQSRESFAEVEVKRLGKLAKSLGAWQCKTCDFVSEPKAPKFSIPATGSRTGKRIYPICKDCKECRYT